MSSQLFEDGKVIVVDGVELECVAVAYQEPNGEREKFAYTFRVKSELDDEREAQRQAEEAQKNNEQAEEEQSWLIHEFY